MAPSPQIDLQTNMLTQFKAMRSEIVIYGPEKWTCKLFITQSQNSKIQYYACIVLINQSIVTETKEAVKPACLYLTVLWLNDLSRLCRPKGSTEKAPLQFSAFWLALSDLVHIRAVVLHQNPCWNNAHVHISMYMALHFTTNQ